MKGLKMCEMKELGSYKLKLKLVLFTYSYLPINAKSFSD